MARSKYPGSSNSLDALCKRFNIDLSRRTKHNALLDCELLREVYINLLDIKEPRLTFSNEDTDLTDINNSKTVDYYKKIISPNDEDKKRHNAFLKQEIKKNFY